MAGQSSTDGSAGTGAGAVIGNDGTLAPALTLTEDEIAACYAELAEWRGLPALELTLVEDLGAGGIAAKRMAFANLGDLRDYAEAFVLVASVNEVAPEGDNGQTAIAAYAETIGGVLDTQLWDDRMISTGSRVLIRQQLIGGCTRDEPSNLLRQGGVYVLPLRFNAAAGAYEVVGDLDVLFELDSEGKIHSHSLYEELNQYDGYTLPDFMDIIHGLY
jgi:hypothetical protein